MISIADVEWRAGGRILLLSIPGSWSAAVVPYTQPLLLKRQEEKHAQPRDYTVTTPQGNTEGTARRPFKKEAEIHEPFSSFLRLLHPSNASSPPLATTASLFVRANWTCIGISNTGSPSITSLALRACSTLPNTTNACPLRCTEDLASMSSTGPKCENSVLRVLVRSGRGARSFRFRMYSLYGGGKGLAEGGGYGCLAGGTLETYVSFGSVGTGIAIVKARELWFFAFAPGSGGDAGLERQVDNSVELGWRPKAAAVDLKINNLERLSVQRFQKCQRPRYGQS